jgi:polysaccharide export outer membrane protein
LALAGCTTLPTEGPSTADVLAPAQEDGYQIVPVNQAVTQVLGQWRDGGLSDRFGSDGATAPSSRVGVGDVLSVQMLEAGREGLFSQGPNGGNRGSFPSIMVDTNGTISLPYVGQISVNGLRPSEIEEAITAALQGRAVEPQASVTVVNSVNNVVAITGDVRRPGQYPLSLRGTRLAQVISLAGGTSFPDYESRITVVRSGVRASTRYDRVLLEDSQNIRVQRDDLVTLSHDPDRYTITGAIGRGGEYPFDATEVSLLEAVSRAGGLLDQRADASGVFVFRFEQAELLRRLGYDDVEALQTNQGIPTVYRVDFKDPTARFYAQTFALRDGDAIYISNSDSTQLGKFLTIFRASISTADAVTSIGAN